MTSTTACAAGTSGWPVQRTLFLLAGTVTLVGLLLGVTVSGWFLLLPALTGLNQLLFVAVGWCPASLLLRRFGASDLRDRPAEQALAGPS